MKAGALLARSGRRHWQRHPAQALLAVAGIALGVAMVVAVDLASESARSSYRWTAETLAGRATHHVLGVTGRLPDSLYAALRLAGLRDARDRPLPMAPVLESRVALAGRRPGSFRLVGLDPFAARDLRALGLEETGVSGAGPGGGLSALLSRPGAVLASRAAAGRLGLAAGDTLPLRIGSRNASVTVIGFLEPRNRLAGTLVDDLLVADLATAQEVLGEIGRLSRIEMDLAGSGTAADPEAGLRERVAALLPAGARLAAADARARTLDAMTRAFRINLTALSLLALLVGAFLIYNTMAFSVAQRWNLLGSLRALGAEPGHIARLVAREAAVLSLIGSAAGLLLGIALGRGLVVLVARTLNDLYFATEVAGLRIEPWVLGKGALLGMGMGLLASWGPAWQAARIRPRMLLTRSSQEDRLRRALPRLDAAGFPLALLSILLALWPGGGIIGGFAALTAAVLAWSLWTPGLIRRVCGGGVALLAGMSRLGRAGPAADGGSAESPRRRGAAGSLLRMALRGNSASLSRTAVAAAALMTALSVTVAMGVMVDSFRRAVRDWLEAVLIADVYVSAPREGSGRLHGTLDSAWAARARALPGLAGSTTYLAAVVEGGGGEAGEPTQVLALALHPGSRAAFRFLAGDSAAAWSAFPHPGCGVLVSEPLAYRRDLAPGRALRLPTRAGPRDFAVAGIFADYGTDRGAVVMDRTCFDRHWEGEARGFTSLAFFAAGSLPIDSLVRRLAALPGSEAVEIHPSRSLRLASLEIFDRTFAITSVLRLAAVIVAVIGLLGALAALELERAPETALLRALGLTPAQVRLLAAAQSAILGLLTGILSVPLGLAQAALLIHVINRRSFGWTMPMQVDPWICAQAVLLGLGAALLASLLPAWKASRSVTARALREE